MKDKLLNSQEIEEYISGIPDEVLSKISFSVPWQYDGETESYKDSDGFTDSTLGDGKKKDDNQTTRKRLQEECWRKFHRNPHMNTAVRGMMGRIAGMGFETTSEVAEIQEVIEEIELDWRNRLYTFWPKYVGRFEIEGELHICFTCHTDGFIEVDFIDPSTINAGGDYGTGIIFHPRKSTMPLFYNIDEDGRTIKDQIPSIFVARDPNMVNLVRAHNNFSVEKQAIARSTHSSFKTLGGYYRFIVSIDKGLVTRRAISYLRTILEWLNHYENLKKYEIDHKKSSGAYVWVFTIDSPKAFKQWLSMSDTDKRKTGIMAKKTPGSSLVLPPGVSVEAKNPSLTQITNQDEDILDLISSGLNEPQDITTGRSKGTYASIKASRGPMSDRYSDEIAYWDRFMRYDFWGSIFFLKSKISNFPSIFKRKEAYDFDSKNNPKFKIFKRKPEQLLDINYPTSEMIDYEGRAKGLLGVKHGPITETLGIPVSETAKRMGFGGYGRLRLRYETEKNRYPELVYAVDAEALQETVEGGETKKSKTKKEGSKEGK